MAYCKNCGREIDNQAVVCPYCGVQQQSLSNNNSQDTGGFGWGLLGFCIPIVGLVLFLVWKTEKPNSAQAAGVGALIGFILGLISSMFLYR